MQGGVGDFTRELARALKDLRQDVTVITASSISGQVAGSPVPVEPIIPNWTHVCWRVIADATRRLKLDVLNIQYEPAAYSMQVGVNLFPWWYRRQRERVPVVTTFHDLLVPYLFPKAGALRWKIVELLAHRSDAVIVTNEEDRLKLQTSNFKLQTPNSKLHLIPIGSNIRPSLPPGFDRNRERAAWGATRNDWLAAYFGFLSMSKGGLTLMRSCSSVRDYLCEHSRCQRIARKVNRRQARVQLVAFVSRLADFVLPETESDMALLEDEACAAVLEGDQQWGLSMQMTWDDRILLRFYYFLSGGCTWNDYNAEPRVYDYALSSKSAALLHYRLLYHNYLLVERPVYWQPSKREPI